MPIYYLDLQSAGRRVIYTAELDETIPLGDAIADFVINYRQISPNDPLAVVTPQNWTMYCWWRDMEIDLSLTLQQLGIPQGEHLSIGLDSLVAGVSLPPDFRNEDFWKKASLYQLIYSISGLVLGLVCVIGGIILFLHGVVGSTSWTANFIGAESNILDAAPGAILFIVGLFVVWVTRFNVKAMIGKYELSRIPNQPAPRQIRQAERDILSRLKRVSPPFPEFFDRITNKTGDAFYSCPNPNCKGDQQGTYSGPVLLTAEGWRQLRWRCPICSGQVQNFL